LSQSEDSQPDHQKLKQSEGDGQLLARVQITKPTHVVAPLPLICRARISARNGHTGTFHEIESFIGTTTRVH
jgi:hypothetical protein